MKRLLLLIAGLFASCGKSDDKCQFSKLTKVTYSVITSKVMYTDNADGCYTVTKTATTAAIKDSKKAFSIDIKTSPNELTINDDGSTHVYTEADGFKIGNTMNGDTLVLRYFPSKNTPSAILPFGIEYKFHN